MGLAWTYLFCAGLCEIGWPVGLKMAQTPDRTFLGVIMAVGCMAASGLLLYLAQRQIPMGTAYAVWDGHRRGRGLFRRIGSVRRSGQPAALSRRGPDRGRRGDAQADALTGRGGRLNRPKNPSPLPRAATAPPPSSPRTTGKGVRGGVSPRRCPGPRPGRRRPADSASCAYPGLRRTAP